MYNEDFGFVSSQALPFCHPCTQVWLVHITLGWALCVESCQESLVSVSRSESSILTQGLSLSFPEQEERSREAVEQWRQWHYDGLYPSHLYNRHHI